MFYDKITPMSTLSPSSPWKLYTDNSLLWEDMLATCETAQQSIDLEQFIFVNDDIGKRFIDVCTRKAAAGVRVRFLLDDAGSWNIFGAFFASNLSDQGIQVRFFNTIIPRSIDNHRWWFFRNHRRSLTVDGKISFTGSMSIWEKSRHWRDANIRIEMKSTVEKIERAFGVMWDRANNIRTNWGHEESFSADGFSYITNAPVRGKQFMYHKLIDTMRAAQTKIYILTPYFIPDRRIIRILRLAARRGVDVRLVLPESSDHRLVDIGGQSTFATLLKNGVQIYRHERKQNGQNNFLHCKVIAIDDDWSSIGSMNFDYVSLRYNFEANIVSTDKDLAAELTEYCLQEMRASDLLERSTWSHRTFLQKWLEFLVRFLKHFL